MNDPGRCNYLTSRRGFTLFLCRLLLLIVTVSSLGRAAWTGSPRLNEIITEAIEQDTTPGAVLLVGHNGEIVHRKAYGDRAVLPEREPMTLDTIFDCASLTKVIVTAPAVMMLVEEGRVRLRDPLSKHLPGFGGGSSPITIEQLLTHYSGLRPDLDIDPEWAGYDTGIAMAFREKPVAPPGSRFLYSDINYILLAELVRKVSGKPLDEFAAERIFQPLRMNESWFRPRQELIGRIAPTERLPSDVVLRGVVHDPSTRFMGGVSGHAGLFSTADDLSRFATMMLNGGALDGVGILSPLAVVKMTTPQSPLGQPVLRGLGWDIESPYSSVRGDLFPAGSYGHTGFTGTSLWIDPFTKTYVLLLTNRVHPRATTSVVSLRSRIASAVAASISGIDVEPLRVRTLETQRAGVPEAGSTGQTLTGLDVLVADGFASLRGKRIGLITNHTGIDRQGRRNVDLLAAAEGLSLEAIFSPEHGIAGRFEQDQIPDSVDGATGTPIFSLYRGDRRPTAEMIRNIDALVFDIQDVGARFYTYATTMAYAMEEAARHGIEFWVLDRPNPITGAAVEGPMLDEDRRSFIGYFPMPVRHAMTVGELARMFNQERGIGAELRVVPMRHWTRNLWFDETGLPWVNPSPNIRTLGQAALYPGVAMLEGLQNLSVGRGTDTPFEFVGADWIQGNQLADYLNSRQVPGARFYPTRRQPEGSNFAGSVIEGVQISLTERSRLQPTRLGLELAGALVRLYPEKVTLEQTVGLIGNSATLRALSDREDPASIWAAWELDQQEFMGIRARYLLY